MVSGSLKVPYLLDGQQGILLACSTAESARVCAVNYQMYEAGGVIRNPYWLYFAVWWFPELAMMNWRGITEGRYRGEQMSELTLGNLLDVVFAARDQPDWRERCAMV